MKKRPNPAVAQSEAAARTAEEMARLAEKDMAQSSLSADRLAQACDRQQDQEGASESGLLRRVTMPSSEVMHKFKSGKLRSGKGGKVVKSRDQALAIMLSERRNEHAHGGEYVSSGERANPLEGTRRPRHHKEK